MAASNINRVVLTGNLTRDPELRSLQSGMSVCSLRIASNSRRKENGEWVDKPNYFSVTVWGAQGENCAALPVQGPPGLHRRPPGVARVAGPGRHQARVGRDRRRVRPVPGRPRRRAAMAAAAAQTTASPRTRTFRRTRRTSLRSPSARATTPPRTTTSRSRPLRRAAGSPGRPFGRAGLRGERASATRRATGSAGRRGIRPRPAARRRRRRRAQVRRIGRARAGA